VLLGLHSLVALVLCNLFLEVTGVRRLALTAISSDLSIDGRNERSEPLAANLGSLSLLHLLPITPVLEPSLVILAEIKVDVESPSHRLNPFKLKSVELGNGNAADLRPGTVLERIVVKELASQKQGDG
jgi:hypothetical protein